MTSKVLKPCSQQTTTTQLSLWATFGPLDTYLQFMIHKMYVLSPSHKVLGQSDSFDSEGIELSFHISESNTPLRNEQEDRENSPVPKASPSYSALLEGRTPWRTKPQTSSAAQEDVLQAHILNISVGSQLPKL